MKIFITGCFLLSCAIAYADVSQQQAHLFAVRCAKMLCTDNGARTLKASLDKAGETPNSQTGWWEHDSFSEAKPGGDARLKDLNIDQVSIRNPDPDNPMRIDLNDDTSGKCVIPPEKIATVYFSNARKDIRAVVIMPIISDRGKAALCPMVIAPVATKQANPNNGATEDGPSQKNISTVPGIQIVRVGDDDNSYGFLRSDHDGKPIRTIETAPLGCTLRQIVLQTTESGVWIKGLDFLPSGRFKVHCELLPGETESVGNKLLNGIADAFNLKIKMADDCLWSGYQVVPPNPLPDCFKYTKENVGQSAMHGIGDYEGYSLHDILSKALHKKPFELISTAAAGRYDVKLDVWPEYYGELAALEKLGFAIKPAKLAKRTLIISASQR